MFKISTDAGTGRYFKALRLFYLRASKFLLDPRIAVTFGSKREPQQFNLLFSSPPGLDYRF